MGDVFLTRISKFLPNAPVSNDDIELYLGLVDEKPSRAKLKVLGNNKISSRYYAMDKDGKSTHSNAALAASAVNGLLDETFSKNDIQLLAFGTMSPEQLLPSHTAMVHGELGCPPAEIVSVSSSCASGFQAMKYAYLSVKAGEVQNAVSGASEKVSTWLRGEKFDMETDRLKELEANPMIAFEKDFMRWMLSDGAAATLLQNQPNKDNISLRVDFIEIKSYANELPPCMYSGATRSPNGKLTGWPEYSPEEWGHQSIFSFKQDTRLLGVKIVPKGGEFLKDVVKKHNLKIEEIDWFLPHLSSEFFRDRIAEELDKIGIDVPQEKWFTNLTKVGNVGSVSPYLILEELFNTGQFKKGQKILVMIPESARFTYIYAHFTVV